MRWAIWNAAFVVGWVAQAGAETTIEASKTKIGKYEKIEFTLRLDERFRDPFAPDEAAVELRLKAPGGRTLAIPAFWCQQYERKPIVRSGRPGDWMYPVGEPVWKARFVPTDVGRYEAWIEVARPGAGSPGLSLLPNAHQAIGCANVDPPVKQRWGRRHLGRQFHLRLDLAIGGGDDEQLPVRVDQAQPLPGQERRSPERAL